MSDIKKKIEDALTRHAQVEAQAIRVTVREGNKVSLEGRVGSWDEREAVEIAAWLAAGVQSVDDRLTIVRRFKGDRAEWRSPSTVRGAPFTSGAPSVPTFLQHPDVIDREVNSMSEFKQIFASFRSSWPRDVRSPSNSETQSMPDQLRVHPSSDRNGIA